MQATFENTSAGDQITLDGTLCEVACKGRTFGDICVLVANTGHDTFYGTPAEFDAANYQHLASREDPVPAKKRK